MFFCFLTYRKQDRRGLSSRNLHERPLPDHYEELSSLSFKNPAAPAEIKALEAGSDNPLEPASNNNYEPLDLKPHDGDSPQVESGETTDVEEKADLTRL